MNKHWDVLWINANLVTCENGYGLINPGAIAVKTGKIAWIGGMSELSSSPEELAELVYDVKGQCITPGLIDCHTHLIYAGNRAHEFELRLHGVSYEEIARQGGGIQSTVTATRQASEDELLTQSLKRARFMLANGVTTLEIKSGYGLDLENELKILRVAKRLADILPIQIHVTLLAAHTTPIEFCGKSDDYINLVCNKIIPKVAKEKLANAVDVFCEKIAFNLEQTERVFKTAQEYNLTIKCHAEQLSDSGSASLAAKYKALSVDHLEYVSEPGVEAIARSGTTAVLLPGAFYFLRETQYPPIQLLRQYNIPMAIATDCNPGTSPILSLLLILNMACTLFRFTPEEALRGVTINAAKALGIEKTHGSLSVGKAADFAVWDVKHPTELCYYLGMNPLTLLIKEGKVIQNESSPMLS